MARVFVATERALGRQVVIKTLPDDTWTSSSVQRFRREILTAAQLQHANIVPVLAAGDAEGTPYFTMPLVDGASLRERIARGAVPLGEAVGILRDVARALSAAHARNVVHRDIKPENILLSSGAALVTDFGVAKAVSAATQSPVLDTAMTAVGVSIGTPAYMAPEQIAADPSLDHRADIYAWGVVAYELLSGERPFATLSGTALARAQMTELPPPLRSVAPTVPASLSALVMQCLAKAPEERPASANALLVVLDQPSGETVTPIPRAPRQGLLLIVVAAVLVVAALGWWMSNDDAAPGDARMIAVAPFRVGGAAQEAQYLREGLGDIMVPQLQSVPDVSAASMRVVLDRWRRAAGSVEADLDDDVARRVAVDAGAGQLIIGDIVGTRENLTVSARLLRADDGQELAQARVEGSADSVAALATKIVTALLSLRDGATRERLRTVLSAQSEAIAAYLQGEQFYRRGRYAEAGQAFAEAYRVDTTFAIAALRVFLSNGWTVDRPPLEGPWLARAWQHRDRLGGSDSLLLISHAGENYPTPRALPARIASMRALAERGNTAELWYAYGDALTHTGGLAGVGNWDSIAGQALDAFRRAEALDSSFASALEHQSMLYFVIGDPEGATRAIARQAARDSTGDFYRVNAFQHAIWSGDTAAQTRAIRRLATHAPVGLLYAAIVQTADFADEFRATVTVSDSVLALLRREHPDALSGNIGGISVREAAWNTGRPALAVASPADRSDVGQVIEEVMAGLLWDGDSAQASRSVKTLSSLLRDPPNNTPPALLQWAQFTVATWSLSQGDTATAERVQRALSAVPLPPESPWTANSARVLASLLRAQLAVARGSPGALAQLDAVDTLLMELPALNGRLRVTANSLLAALYDASKEPERALGVLGRRDGQYAVGMYAPDRQWRIARIAEHLGRREEAIVALRHYIAMREKAEPHLQGAVREARERLRRLEAESSGR